jgi:homoserine kinase
VTPTPSRVTTVRVPASTSNLGAGFDCVGVAVDRWLTVSAHSSSAHSSSAHSSGAGAAPCIERHGTAQSLDASLGTDAECDLIYVGFRSACAAAARQVPDGLRFEVHSDIPIGRGLGSSAAAAVAGAALANIILALGLHAPALARVCAQIEGHADNVAPMVFGGATLAVMAPDGSLTVSPLEVHESLALVFAIPDFTVATKLARAALPDIVPHHTAVRAAAKSAALVRGLATADAALLAAALDDVLHVPYRRALIRGYDAVTAAAVQAGAFGATLSGAGSGLVAIAPRAVASRVESTMATAWRAYDVAADTFQSAGRVPGYEIQSVSASVGQCVSESPRAATDAPTN